MQDTTTVGLDLAKDTFQVFGRNAAQQTTFSRKLKRKAVLVFFARLPACLIGIEACASSHYWARELKKLGHTVKLMHPKYVKGYLKRGKTDAADAEAICEAVPRLHVSEVPAKCEAQQCTLMLHKTRNTLLKQRTLMSNVIRAHMAELGLIDAKGHAGFKRLLAIVADDANRALADMARAALKPLALNLAAIETGLARLDAEIYAAHKADATSVRLETAPGVGPIGASAFSATVSNPRAFKSGRHFAASLGVTPRLDGTGGVVKLGPITKQGNGYLRRLLYLGAVARLQHARRRPDKASPWILRLLAKYPFKHAAIAVANKTARIIWALLVHGGVYVADHQPAMSAAGAPARP